MRNVGPILLALILAAIANGQETKLKDPNDPCYWKDSDGTCQTNALLEKILAAHREWLHSQGEEKPGCSELRLSFTSVYQLMVSRIRGEGRTLLLVTVLTAVSARMGSLSK